MKEHGFIFSVKEKVVKYYSKAGLRQFTWRFLLFAILSFLLIPFLLEFLAEVFGLKLVLELSYTDFSLFAVLAIVLFFFFNRQQIVTLEKYQLKKTEAVLFSLISLGLYFLYFFLKYLAFETALAPQVEFPYLLGTYVLYGLAVFSLLLAVFGLHFLKKFYESISAAFLLSFCYFLLTYLMRTYWLGFSSLNAKINYYLLSLFSPAHFAIAADGITPALKLINFEVLIGSPCSGVSSLSLFILFFIGIVGYDYQKIKLSKTKIGILFLAGLLGMFLVSILRVFLIMLIGGYYSTEIALGLFHSNVAWVLFVAYLGIFWYLAYPWLFRKK